MIFFIYLGLLPDDFRGESLPCYLVTDEMVVKNAVVPTDEAAGKEQSQESIFVAAMESVYGGNNRPVHFKVISL